MGWSYHASHAGHDGIQVALGMAFRPSKDWLFPYYRDMLTCLAAGITPYELILNGLSKADDLASGGRHMSNHFAKHRIGIWNVSSAPAITRSTRSASRVRSRPTATIDRLLQPGRVVDLRGLRLRSAQRRHAREAPRRLRRAEQRLRHLGAGERADGEPYRLGELSRLPNLSIVNCDGKTRSTRSARCGRRSPSSSRGGPGARPRGLPPDPRAFELRPARALPHARRAGRREAMDPLPRFRTS